MKKILILVVISLLFNENVNSQCKFKDISKSTRFAISDDCNIKVDIATKMKLIFDKYYHIGGVSFVKSGADYYFYLIHVRKYCSKHEMLKNNSLVLIFDNEESLTLYPCGDFRGKRSRTFYNIGCFYNITKAQTELIAENTIKTVLIHITCDKDISATQIDEDGTQFFEYPIYSQRKSNNVSESAACILSK